MFLIVIAFLCSGLGAYIVSCFCGNYKEAVFTSCVLGIPGLAFAFGAIKIFFKMLDGTAKLSFENSLGVIGGAFIASLLLAFPISMFNISKDK
jgi:hypothetical protein